MDVTNALRCPRVRMLHDSQDKIFVESKIVQHLVEARLFQMSSVLSGGSALNFSEVGFNPLSARSDNSFSAANTPSYQNFSLLSTGEKKSGESRMPSAVTDSGGDRYDYHETNNDT